ncbi:butyrophilin subfamily 1 member A1-like isoform X1 [Scomber scombrus]|uniref:Butyrophilin subfamily 1 member A1-like isoform X1 n=1 Tax=Scomber scombrus TaxID=13677 RepID=A0AAV1QCY7_SCOSC
MSVVDFILTVTALIREVYGYSRRTQTGQQTTFQKFGQVPLVPSALLIGRFLQMRSVLAVILLLMVVLYSAGGQTPITLNVTQDIYQAEEHSDTSLIWLFPFKPNKPPLTLSIDIIYVKSHRAVFVYNSKNEANPYQDELYRGRVWCDPELAKTGRIECLFTNLTLNDTGTYLCVVVADGNDGYKSCDLIVKAFSEPTVEETPQLELQPEPRGRIGLYVGSGLFGVTSAAVIIRYLTLLHTF